MNDAERKYGEAQSAAPLVGSTRFGATVELHAAHYEPLLEVVREAKRLAYKKRSNGGLWREIEHRLETAQRTIPRSGDDR